MHDIIRNPKGIPHEINNKTAIVDTDVESLVVGD